MRPALLRTVDVTIDIYDVIQFLVFHTRQSCLVSLVDVPCALAGQELVVYLNSVKP